MLTTIGRQNSISLTRPSPHLWKPKPPLFSLMLNLCKRTGYHCSKISGSVILVFVM
uniref:OXP1 n=1 Tax=Arundo donax TaxID=35708 RepID=A0A0A9DVN7_ARUDO